MKHMKIIILVAAVATLAMPISGNAEVNQPQKNITRFCYQGLCLNDPISKLSLPIVASKRESVIDLVKNIAKNHEDMKVAPKLFIGNKKDVEILAKNGFVSGSPIKINYQKLDALDGTALLKHGSLSSPPIEINQKTLDALKNVKTICGYVANFAKVRVAASNGKQLALLYALMTDEEGVSTYGLIAILAPYPEVQSYSEMDDLISKASVAMNVKLRCSIRGTGEECRDDTRDEVGTQDFNIDNGQLMIRNRYGYNFSLDMTRKNAMCKNINDVNF